MRKSASAKRHVDRPSPRYHETSSWSAYLGVMAVCSAGQMLAASIGSYRSGGPDSSSGRRSLCDCPARRAEIPGHAQPVADVEAHQDEIERTRRELRDLDHYKRGIECALPRLPREKLRCGTSTTVPLAATTCIRRNLVSSGPRVGRPAIANPEAPIAAIEGTSASSGAGNAERKRARGAARQPGQESSRRSNGYWQATDRIILRRAGPAPRSGCRIRGSHRGGGACRTARAG
jgi:hypothetical protein